MQREIEESAHSYHERYRSGQDIIVGVNKFVTDQVDDVDILKVDPESEQSRPASRSASASPASRPSREGSTRGCIGTASGRCASTRGSPPPRTPTSATAT